MLSLFKKSPVASGFLQSTMDQIATSGFAVLRAALPKRDIDEIRGAAQAFYAVVERDNAPTFPRSYLYNAGNMAVGMAALDDHGTKDYFLLRTVANSPAAECLRYFLGADVLCSLTHSRMRKSYPQADPNRPRPSTVAWHADGDTNVGYFSAYILWVPFTPCNRDYPGLEFKGLNESPVAVSLEPGDALLFSSTTQHRTADCPTSTRRRRDLPPAHEKARF